MSSSESKWPKWSCQHTSTSLARKIIMPQTQAKRLKSGDTKTALARPRQLKSLQTVDTCSMREYSQDVDTKHAWGAESVTGLTSHSTKAVGVLEKYQRITNKNSNLA